MVTPVAKSNEFKSKHVCILEASESTRMRVEESLSKYNEDHIAGKRDNSLKHYNLVHKLIPLLQAIATKAAVDQEWENKKDSSEGHEKSETNQR